MSAAAIKNTVADLQAVDMSSTDDAFFFVKENWNFYIYDSTYTGVDNLPYTALATGGGAWVLHTGGLYTSSPQVSSSDTPVRPVMVVNVDTNSAGNGFVDILYFNAGDSSPLWALLFI